ncbi:TPA: hypothetical protein RMI67_006678, partial [Bacillus cereus]|nr:hypothetical protein [Bacillus cereus]
MDKIKNGDFNEGLHFWKIENGEVYIIKQKNKQSIVIDGYGSITQKIPINPNTTYTFSFQIETMTSENFEIQIEEINTQNYSSNILNIFNQNSSNVHEITTNSQTDFLEITIENHSNYSITLHNISLNNSSSPNNVDIDEDIPLTHNRIYFENFKPGISIWEHTIVNQNSGQGECKNKAIGHVYSLPFKPYTQYIISMDIKPLISPTSSDIISLGIFHSSNPHILLKQFDKTDIETEWFPIQLAYRTDEFYQGFDRILLQSTVPLAFTNISIIEVSKLFHEDFKTSTWTWNNLDNEKIENTIVGYIRLNGQTYTNLQSIPFEEKKQYILTAHVKNESKFSYTATCYIEYKNILTGVLIRKPISIISETKNWEKIEMNFFTPEKPWIVSTIGFTYQGDQRLTFTQISIEPNLMHTECIKKTKSFFETHTEINSISPKKNFQTDTNEIVSSAATEIVHPFDFTEKDFQ